jgi:signal transduction histidine kinase
LEEQIKNDGRSALTYPEFGRATSEFIWTEDDEESLRVLKLGGAVGIFMLLAYLAYDLQLRGGNAPGAGLHWLTLAATCLFFAMTWTRPFKRRWKSWVLLFILFVIAMFVLISRVTGNPESRFITIMLCPLVTAAFVIWGTRWQFAMAVMALLSYAAAQYLAPIATPYGIYRWMGLIAAVILAQYAAIFIGRFRRRLRQQVQDLEEAARFRQTQIATMAHDIRSPVAALSGYVNLLEEADIGPKERADLLERIGSTAWNMDLVVSNVLDYYEVQEDDVIPAPAELDPNQVLSEVAEDCALQARRRHLKLRIEIARLPACKLDRRHFERIVRNMLAYAIGRIASGEVVLRARMRNESIAVEVTDSGPPLSPAEMEALFERPDKNGDRGAARGLGLYIARAMAEAAGGRVEARFADGRRGLTLGAEFPLEAQPPKARTP